MSRLMLVIVFLVPSMAFAQTTRAEREAEEAALEADMAASRARIRELRQRKKHVRVQEYEAASEEPYFRPRPRKSTFFAEPRVGWSMLNRRSGGSMGLLIGGVIRERVQLAASINTLYSPRGGVDWPGAGLAYGGLDPAIIIVRHDIVRFSLGGMLGGGGYFYMRY